MITAVVNKIVLYHLLLYLFTWFLRPLRHQVVNYLLHHGANPNAVDSNHYTPLDYATTLGNKDVVRLLTSSGAMTSDTIISYRSNFIKINSSNSSYCRTTTLNNSSLLIDMSPSPSPSSISASNAVSGSRNNLDQNDHSAISLSVNDSSETLSGLITVDPRHLTSPQDDGTNIDMQFQQQQHQQRQQHSENNSASAAIAIDSTTSTPDVPLLTPPDDSEVPRVLLTPSSDPPDSSDSNSTTISTHQPPSTVYVKEKSMATYVPDKNEIYYEYGVTCSDSEGVVSNKRKSCGRRLVSKTHKLLRPSTLLLNSPRMAKRQIKRCLHLGSSKTTEQQHHHHYYHHHQQQKQQHQQNTSSNDLSHNHGKDIPSTSSSTHDHDCGCNSSSSLSDSTNNLQHHHHHHHHHSKHHQNHHQYGHKQHYTASTPTSSPTTNNNCNDIKYNSHPQKHHGHKRSHLSHLFPKKLTRLFSSTPCLLDDEHLRKEGLNPGITSSQTDIMRFRDDDKQQLSHGTYPSKSRVKVKTKSESSQNASHVHADKTGNPYRRFNVALANKYRFSNSQSFFDDAIIWNCKQRLCGPSLRLKSKQKVNLHNILPIFTPISLASGNQYGRVLANKYRLSKSECHFEDAVIWD